MSQWLWGRPQPLPPGQLVVSPSFSLVIRPLTAPQAPRRLGVPAPFDGARRRLPWPRDKRGSAEAASRRGPLSNTLQTTGLRTTKFPSPRSGGPKSETEGRQGLAPSSAQWRGGSCPVRPPSGLWGLVSNPRFWQDAGFSVGPSPWPLIVGTPSMWDLGSTQSRKTSSSRMTPARAPFPVRSHGSYGVYDPTDLPEDTARPVTVIYPSAVLVTATSSASLSPSSRRAAGPPHRARRWDCL